MDSPLDLDAFGGDIDKLVASVVFRAVLLWAQKETARALLLEAKIEADRKLARVEAADDR